jgi:uncharacterized membrane protein YfcA
LGVFLPIAGLSVSLPLLVGTGFAIGFLSGLVGVGGGFLLTPALMIMGIGPAVAAASGSNTVVATSASGVAAHFRLGNVDIRMGSILLIGGLTGGAVGVRLIEAMRALGEAGVMITLTYILVLGGVGGYMLRKSLGRRAESAKVEGSSLLRRLPLQMDFPRSGVRLSALGPFAVAAAVGVLASMGRGGGFVLVPAMVYLLGMPEHVAVGTSLFEILFTCSGVTFMEATANGTVDVVLVVLLAVGSTVGAQLGARASVRLRGSQLMVPLAVLVLGVMAEMVFRILRTPTNLLEATAALALWGARS